MSLATLRIAYLGLPLGALALAREGFRPQVVCLGHPDAPGARRVRRVLGRSALVLGKPDLEDPATVRALASARPDVLLSWFWPKLVPEGVLALAPRGAFGVHPSLLPRWRGPDPYFWALRSGDLETGVTLHRLAREYDTGTVIAQRSVAIAAGDNSWRLAKKLDRPGLELLVQCAHRLTAGEPLMGEPQDESAATDAPQPDDDLLSIDWHEPTAEILQLVSAAAPLPGASAQLGDELVDVLGARRFAGKLPRALEPADAALSAEGVVICSADGGVLLDRVRCEDGEMLQGAEIAELFPHGLARLPRS